MKLTPLDIRHKEFKRGMRGYADTEVDEFLDEIADEFERVFKDNIDAGERIEALEARIAQYRLLEETLQKTLVSAQHSADELKTNATKEAQLILQEAEVQARTMTNELFADKQKIEKEMVMLRGAEEEFRFKFRALLEGYLKQLVGVDQVAVDRAAAQLAQTDTDFARQAEAIKAAIGREDTAAGGQRAPAVGARPETGAEVARGAQSEPAPQPAEEAAPAATQPAEEAVPAARQPAETASIETPPSAAAPAAIPDAPIEHSLVGDEDDLLADIENEIGDNEFKW